MADRRAGDTWKKRNLQPTTQHVSDGRNDLQGPPPRSNAGAGLSSQANVFVKQRYEGPGTPAPNTKLREAPPQNAASRGGTWSPSTGTASEPQERAQGRVHVPHGGRLGEVPGLSGSAVRGSFRIGDDAAGSGGNHSQRPSGARGPVDRPDGHRSHFNSSLSFQPRDDAGGQRGHRGAHEGGASTHAGSMGRTLTFTTETAVQPNHASLSRADHLRTTVDKPPRPHMRLYAPVQDHHDIISYRHSGGINPPPDKVFRDREARQREYESQIPRYHDIERQTTALVNTAPPRDQAVRRPAR